MQEPKQISESITPTELNVSEGAECSDELNDWQTHTADERFD